MAIELKDLINITNAAKLNAIDVNDILLAALDGKILLVAVSNKKARDTLIPCQDGELHHASVGEYIHQINPLFDKKEHVDIELGQVIELKQTQIKELIVNKNFSEAELYKNLAPKREDLKFDFWKTEREVYEWEEDLPEYTEIGLDQIYVIKDEIRVVKEEGKKNHSVSRTKDTASNTALKVISLLMHHLAKSPKYASGSSPNKSQIKELLIDLAVELDINQYGLSKVDERLLTDALSYLDSQKN